MITHEPTRYFAWLLAAAFLSLGCSGATEEPTTTCALCSAGGGAGAAGSAGSAGSATSGGSAGTAGVDAGSCATSATNENLLKAYGATQYFLERVDKWNKKLRSSKVKEVQSRPRPLLWANQVRQLHGTFETVEAEFYELASRHFDFVVVNTNDDLLAEEDDSRADLVKINKKVQEAVGKQVDTLTGCPRGKTYFLPYHRVDSCSNNKNTTWKQCSDHGWWLRTSDNGYVGYGDYSTSERRFFNSTLAELRDYWAKDAAELVQDGADGIFSDNHLNSSTLLNPKPPYKGGIELKDLMAGWNAMDQALVDKTSDDVFIIGNGLPWGVYNNSASPYTVRDYSMMEDWRTDTLGMETWAAGVLKGSAVDSENSITLDSCGDPKKGDLWPYRIALALQHDFPLGIDRMYYTPELIDTLDHLGKVGYPLADSKLLQGDGEKYLGLYSREYTHGVAIVNTSESASFECSVPEGVWYDTVDKKPVSPGARQFKPKSGVVWRRAATYAP